ncbi:haloalkane dehalogenase [Amylibacter sp. IMCC11727]|uniref:haloalkane dehalogenase n=1 Tax=Amylibacter sp. IMCC11727 TaxID=3039851 RepID=UPI00244E3C17|nr:haloalkane dehalogenase [Amylibacter sp. IMCC11727]WGI23186.1 haloalkane dehalogenase [Amylibacter sp. IMCC11727]
MDVLRTPDDRFRELPDWDFAPHYVDDLAGYEGLRVHYVDEGPKDAERVFLCLHGQPTWSYLYRKMIPEFAASGARVIAPDWLGFGRSDKPMADDVYRFHFHRDMMIAFVQALDLKNITLVVQDWGGVLGLTMPHAMPDRISRLLVMNTALAIGTPAGKGFNDWRAYNKANPDMDIAALMARSTPILSEAEAAAYGAPFPDVTYKAGVRRFPDMVMTDPDMEGVNTSKAALNFYQNDWAGESFMAIGMQDPVLGPPVMEWLKSVIKGCPEPMKVADAGHFVQEWGGPIATAAMKHWGDI